MTLIGICGPTTALDKWLYVSRGIVPGNVMALEDEMSKWTPSDIRSLYEHEASVYSTAWELKDDLDAIATQLEAKNKTIAELAKALGGVRANLVRLAWEENSVMIEGIDKALSKAQKG